MLLKIKNKHFLVGLALFYAIVAITFDGSISAQISNPQPAEKPQLRIRPSQNSRNNVKVSQLSPQEMKFVNEIKNITRQKQLPRLLLRENLTRQQKAAAVKGYDRIFNHPEFKRTLRGDREALTALAFWNKSTIETKLRIISIHSASAKAKWKRVIDKTKDYADDAGDFLSKHTPWVTTFVTTFGKEKQPEDEDEDEDEKEDEDEDSDTEPESWSSYFQVSKVDREYLDFLRKESTGAANFLEALLKENGLRAAP